ncbi:hypothetical protein FIBSPDRAFT_919761 [Athelia psychrophila]|uniref:Prokaryotic-type class I peptide chain release factors domain-containing protein n=1 Tax=Athelia psychrophila TaxID=1759441 RepID=A0A166JE58_9AGAM|nr:hypothetical protein FIBSPDRAFT_919761 [Fibularhizoctonia sp. CBS 109695]
MSISASLRASGRAAYRDLYRASSLTFTGDERVLRAFREKMRTDALSVRGTIDPVQFEEQVKLGREIAEMLRKNVVQAYKAPVQPTNGEQLWQIQLREGIEMGENDTIKNPPPPDLNSRRARKQDKDFNSADAASPKPTAPRFYSALKKAHQQRKPAELNEDDLEETHVRGSGPGGQSINKTSNNVQLIHRPSGIRVTCQITRSLETNRMLARRILLEKLDKIENPGLSKGDLRRAKQNERERRRRKKAKKKALTQEREDIFAPSDSP